MAIDRADQAPTGQRGRPGPRSVAHQAFGDFTAVDDLDLTSRRARSSPCSGRPAAARRRRCGWSPGSRSPPPAQILDRRRGHHRAPSRTSGRSTRCSRAMRCSRTWTSSRTSRSACAGAAPRTSKQKVDEVLELVAARHLARRKPRPALRRPAAARRAGPGPRQPARGAAARRAARRPRPQAAPADAARAQADPDRGRHHVRARHARPGGGHDDGRHHRGDERRAGSSSWATPPSSTRTRVTTFVANFLGQSNLFAADGSPALGRRPRARRPRARRSPCRAAAAAPTSERQSGSACARRRLHVDHAARTARDPGNGSTGRSPTRSFIGVSTQYLVRLPWGQELTVVRQNDGHGARSARRSRSTCSWEPDAHLRPRRGAGRARR